MRRWLWRWNRIGPPLLGGLIIIAATLIVWLQARGGDTPKESSQAVSLAAGDVAPDFSLPAVGGDIVSLGDSRGKDVLLYFSMGYG